MNSDNAQNSVFVRAYDKIFLSYPIVTVLVGLGVVAFFAQYIPNFKIDMSSDSITLENDESVRYYSYTRELFGSDDYVFLTVVPKADLFSDEVIEELTALSEEFTAIEHIESVTSILTVPLFHSPDVPLMLAATGFKTLGGGADRVMAKKELVESPMYLDLLISKEADATNFQINFKETEQQYNDIYNRRQELRFKKQDDGLTVEEKAELKEVSAAWDEYHMKSMTTRRNTITEIREVLAKHEDIGEMYLGGVPMIMSDIVDYVLSDMLVFGIGVVVIIVIMLTLIFRDVKWVLLPTVTCVLTVLIMVGFLGYSDWWTTIVTSNFTSLLLIMGLAMSIHITVRFREIYAGNPEADKRWLIVETVRHVGVPCFYMALTTCVGFGSLFVSNIRPVMDFGLMMSMGLGIAYLMCFLFLPAAFLLFPKGKVPPARLAELTQTSSMSFFARFTERHKATVAIGAVIIVVVCIAGTTRLTVENRFIDYFKTDTAIYEGMTIIDERLGGTTPLEVVLKGEGKGYWLQSENLAKLEEVHAWLDAQPETGKVISLDTLHRMLKGIHKAEVPTALLNVVINMVPEDIKAQVIRPYSTEDFDEIMIAMRVRESSHDLNRKDLLARIDAYFASDESPLDVEEANTTGMFVLYNNLLQSLWRSQIVTIGAVFFAIWFMFVLLFRSPSLATIAIIPNALPVVLVLGILGWVGVPLDIMTIMIAAITLGIAVDDTVHYIHRFREEFPKDRNYVATMHRCHSSIGRAILYTSMTIIVGFSVLTASNFIPNIYFGLFTGLAMLCALLACMTLLPLLLITWKPLGREGDSPEESAA